MLYMADRFTLWLGWIVLASLLFSVVPAGPYGLAGWIAAVGPLVHRISPRIGIRRVAVIGLLAIGTTLVFGVSLHWLELLLPAPVFLLGLLLAPVPITGTPAPQQASRVAAEERFQLALAREVGRARRYERPITLVSAACDDVTELDALGSALSSQVHVYAQLFQVGHHLLLIVPELDAARYPSVERRLLEAIRSSGIRTVTLGAASFPQGECTASGLIEVAESSRRRFDLTADGFGRPSRKQGSEDYGLPQP